MSYGSSDAERYVRTENTKARTEKSGRRVYPHDEFPYSIAITIYKRLEIPDEKNNTKKIIDKIIYVADEEEYERVEDFAQESWTKFLEKTGEGDFIFQEVSAAPLTPIVPSDGAVAGVAIRPGPMSFKRSGGPLEAGPSKYPRHGETLAESMPASGKRKQFGNRRYK